MKLQRDWRIPDSEPEQLPFAKNIKGHALVSLVQKGLRYHHSSLLLDDNGQQRTLVPSMFFFGPESAGIDTTEHQKESLLKASASVRGVSPASTIAHASKAKTRDVLSVAPEDTLPPPAKRGRKPAQSFSADKASVGIRKVSGATDADSISGQANQQNATSPASIPDPNGEEPFTNGYHDDAMDVDKDAEAQADTLMQDDTHEPEPLIPTLETGVSVDIQVAPTKAIELTSSSAILSVDSKQSISQALWRPADAATLIARGETFCAVWNLNGQDLRPDSVKPSASSLFPSRPDVLVTAAAWDPTGSLLAVAIWSEQEAQIHLFEGQDLSLIEHLPASQRGITMLEWHAAGRQLVAIAPSDAANEAQNGHAGSAILCWDLSTLSGTSQPLVLNIPDTVLAIVSNSNEDLDFFIATDNGVYQCSSSDELSIIQHYASPSSKGRAQWMFIEKITLTAHDTTAVAVAAERATIWLPEHNIGKDQAHNAPITSLQVRPSLHPSNGHYNSPEVATSSEDGTIKIWNMTETSIELVQQLQFEPSAPIMALSYSPNGYYLAAASYSTVCIWNAQHAYTLTAKWTGPDGEWRGTGIRDDDMASAAGRSSVNGDGSTGADQTLSWHIDNTRLAFGIGSQLAIINAQR